MEQFISTRFFFSLKNALKNDIDVNTKVLENSYKRFAVLLFSESAAGNKAEYHNALAYTRVELASLKKISKKNVAAYLNKATLLIDEQIKWIEKLLLTEQNIAGCSFRKRVLSEINLQWTAKKTDLIELLYALDAAACFNFGNVSLNQIAIYLENVFSANLSHFPRDFYEMRIRNNQTPFIEKLKILLKKRMDNPKKPYRKDNDAG